MVITICDVPEHLKPEIDKVGGKVARHWNCLMDVRFENHKIYVRDNYVKVRSKDHNALILAFDEFSNMYIQ